MFEKKYLVMETIGRNSKKMTSIVRDKQNNYFIAKKVPLQDQKTAHEIEVMKTLKHPNIIALHELIVDQQWAYVIEEYCEEGDLQYHLRRQLRLKRNLPEAMVARWLLQILLAIEYLHHLHIIHRDIRPRNIFLTAAGNIKLGSFKVSKMLEEQASYAHTLINSPYYMTPELLQARAYDHKVDIWAFGCVMYEICSLKPPLSLASVGELLGKISSKKTDDLPSHYSKTLNGIYHKCMKRNPQDRTSARQLLKTNYFMDAMEVFIRDKCLNVAIKIPIKQYKIHKNRIDKITKQKPPKSKKESALPKIQQHQGNSRPGSRQKQIRVYSREKKEPTIQTPIIKRHSKSKDKYMKCASTEKKREKTQFSYPSKPSRPTFFHEDRSQMKELKPPPCIDAKETGSKKMHKAPPMLPKPIKKQDQQSPIGSQKRAKTRVEPEPELQTQNSFDMTMSKEELSKGLKIRANQQDLKEVNAGLNKVFEALNIRESDQQEIEFEFEDDTDLRLTHKNEATQAEKLMQTCKEFIDELNRKYHPDMQPIPEKTTEFDSSDLGRFSKLSFPSSLK